MLIINSSSVVPHNFIHKYKYALVNKRFKYFISKKSNKQTLKIYIYREKKQKKTHKLRKFEKKKKLKLKKKPKTKVKDIIKKKKKIKRRHKRGKT